MNPIEYVRCEGCGELHPESECETIIVKIVKGKHCSLKPVMGQQKTTIAPQPIARIEPKDPPPPEQDEYTPAPVPRKNIIPPGMASMMLPPDSPLHDRFGAKETRRV